ncbi:MAG: zinc metallopeptidase, partial [Isosphaeraceae bacterium]|nr:zinc metallopeptidase [Isosphaeraceae bacterium]
MTMYVIYLIFEDPIGVLFPLLPVALALWVRLRIGRIFRRWASVESRSAVSGSRLVEELLAASGAEATTRRASGPITEYYDKINHQIRLSDHVWDGTSLAALGIAAQKAGHALGDDRPRWVQRLHDPLVFAVRLGAQAGWLLLGAGLLLATLKLYRGGGFLLWGALI